MPKRTRSHHEFLLEQLKDPLFAAEYLNEAHKDSQQAELKALRNIAEAYRMVLVAEDAGVNRVTMYKTLSEEGNPRLETFNSILRAVHLRYEYKPEESCVVPPTISPITQAASQTSEATEVNTTPASQDAAPLNLAAELLNVIFISDYGRDIASVGNSVSQEKQNFRGQLMRAGQQKQQDSAAGD